MTSPTTGPARSTTDELPAGDADFLQGGGEMGARIRAFDWPATPLGPATSWPRSLKTAIRIMLTSRQPFWLGWGPELTYFYNDPYKAIIGGKHPYALGQPTATVWREIWDVIAPMLATAIRGDEGTYVESQLLIMERHGYQEETYYTFSYSPVPDDEGRPAGIICANTDDTERVIGERQLALLSKLGSDAADARSFEEACVRSVEALEANPRDLPFAMAYLANPERRSFSLAAACGIAAGHAAAPRSVAFDGRSLWPLAHVLDTQAMTVVSDLSRRFPALPTAPWPKAPTEAALLPIVSAGPTGRPGILVVGLNPFRQLDDVYRRFLVLVAGQIAASAANADAYEQERKRAEALAELDRAKTTFFSNVSHEFRTPLTLLLGPIEDSLADTAEPLTVSQRQRQEIAHRNAVRLLRLVNTLLDFSRIEAGRAEAVYEPVDLSALTADLASTFRSAVERAGLALIVDCAPLPESVHVDREMWEKIVLNLLSNAFKFTFDGAITVALRAAGPRVDLSVGDTGTGIPARELPHLFERFHRVRDARGRTHEGSGIGLALVQELVKLHGGTAAVTSELGRGSTFTVTIPFGHAHLPADRIGATRTMTSTALGAAPFVEEALRWLPEEITPDVAEPSTAPIATRGERILLADDNADMRDYVRRLLGQHWIVEAVGDGRAALEAARARRPDLVLTDVMMPHLDGVALLRGLRASAATRNVPVILLSARAGEASRVEGLEAGADDYLVKPFSARELIARVNAHLELARVRREMVDREQVARLEAEQANRAKDEFLATLSHELRTPLNAILGWTVLLRSGPADGPMLPRALEVIERNARAQAQLIEDLLDVSRIITGKMRLDVRAVDLAGAVNAAIDSVRPAASAKDIRLHSILDPNAGPIAGDPDRLQQVMWNLLSNAVKFTPKNGRVQVRVERIESHVEVVVSDTGCGIDSGILPYVFDRFRQADSSASRRHGGLGLGLALVKHLVELHGGSVRAVSPGVDRGATFIVKLPLMAQQAPEDGAREHPTARGAPLLVSADLAGLRLLVVDDEQETLELFTSLFAQHGAEIAVASSAAQALDRLRAFRPDVLICDIEMPGEDGYALIGCVRALPLAQGGAVPAVAVTAYGSVEHRIRILSAGFQMHVPKPVEPAELLTVVASVSGRRPR